MICLDTSAYMRNGDYGATRMFAQQDAANTIISRRLNPPFHPENTVGVLTMGGKRVQLQSSPTRDQTPLFEGTHDHKPGGDCHFLRGLQIAALALKHRSHSRGSNRIIAFVGTPIGATDKELKRLAKTLKRNYSAGVDVIMMGENEENREKLDAFIRAVNKEDNSHLFDIPTGVSVVDQLRRSHLCTAGSSGPSDGSSGGGSADAFAEFGGIDPNVDPEMAQVMRISLMEQREAMERASRDAGGDGGSAAGAAMAMDGDAALAMALRMSMEEVDGGGGDSGGNNGSGAPTPPSPPLPRGPVSTPAACRHVFGEAVCVAEDVRPHVIPDRSDIRGNHWSEQWGHGRTGDGWH